MALLLGARPECVAIVENSTAAFALALSAFDFRPGDVVVTSQNDYTSNQIMYLALSRRLGIEVRHAAELPEGGVDPEAVGHLAADRRCRLVALTWIPTNSGLVQDAEAVGEICERLGVPFLLDACQALGQLPIDVARLRCDFLAVTARKFLRGPRGIGCLYVSERALARGAYPLYADMRGARWGGGRELELAAGAQRFENWEFSYALVLGLGEAARYAGQVGVARAGALAADLASYARARLAELPGVRVHDRGARLCAIATAEIAGRGGDEVKDALRAAGVNVSSAIAGPGPINPDRTGPNLVRISPHYYNTREEIDRAVELIAELAASAGRAR
jgi:selenocysteine lyase/cysteine desulfurase